VIFSHFHIHNNIKGEEAHRMVVQTTVRQVLLTKGVQAVYSVHPGQSVFEALQMMERRNIGALVVVERGQLVGVVSERDYARKVALNERMSRSTSVSEIMSSPVVCVTSEDAVEGCLSLMTERRIRHLPVLDDGELVGLISVGDVVKSVIADQEFMIDELTKYTTGSYAGCFDSFGPGRARVEEHLSGVGY
jgi:CBS domain-containing protein